MKKIFILTILCFIVCAFQGASTSRVRSWMGSVTAGSFQPKVLGDIRTTQGFSYDIFNAGTVTLWANIKARDTSAADGSGYSGYINIPAGTFWTFANIVEDTVWVKSSSGTITNVIIVKY